MDILFINDKMRKTFTTRAAVRAEFGTDNGDRILRRLDDLRMTPTLEGMRLLPGRCHEMKHDLAGSLSIDIRHPYRLLFEPVGEDLTKADGGLDWTKVTTIRIIRVEDTHD